MPGYLADPATIANQIFFTPQGNISANNIQDAIVEVDNEKAPLASPTFTGNIVLPSTTSIGNVSSNELGYLDGLTEPLTTTLAAKAPLASPTFTGTVALPSTTTVGGKNVGMVLLGSGSVSAGTTINFTSMLSSTYNSYKVVLTGYGSVTNTVYLRMRSGSTDATGANYDFGYNLVTFTNGATTTTYAASATAVDISRWSTSITGKIIEITNAVDAAPTTISYSGVDNYAFSAFGVGVHKLATAYDGISIYVASGTMTATAHLYATTK